MQWGNFAVIIPPRPDHPTEKGRIEAAGGSVTFEDWKCNVRLDKDAKKQIYAVYIFYTQYTQNYKYNTVDYIQTILVQSNTGMQIISFHIMMETKETIYALYMYRDEIGRWFCEQA